ncbi:MAG: OB-fold nucleic acid binding domain-containing protein [Candidatus Micrarchaeota archaeon]
MKISELNPGTGNVSLNAEVIAVGEVREINKYGRILKVANITLKDESGQIDIALWNEAIDTVKVGDKISIENGYVNEWKGTKQLTLGKFGKMSVQ